jgi:DNA-binding Lrp family transcriptional regulator
MKKVGMETGRFIEIVSYMESNDMLVTGETVSKPAEAPPEYKPSEETPSEKPEEGLPPIPLLKTEEGEEKEIEKKELPTEKPKEEFPTPAKEPEKTEEFPPAKPQEEPPPIPLLKTEGVVEAGEKSSALKVLVSESTPQEQVQPVSRTKAYARPRIPKTPLEKKLYSKFGDDGLYAYSIIDEFKTPREIVKQTGMSEERLREIIEFMKQEGIIKLERPLIAPVEQPPAEEKLKPVKPVVPSPGAVAPFRAPPMTTPLQPKPAIPQPEPPKSVAALPVQKPAPIAFKPVQFTKQEVCVSTALPLKLVNKLKLEGELLRRYGNDGSKVLSLMNGKKVNVKIMKELKMSPARFDEITSFLLENGAIKLQCLTPENVRELYGDEGFSIYSKYGRDGILLYEFIDKKSSLKDIVKMSGIEPRLAVEIFAFIHKVLGLDIPIDTELLYKQLGIRP